MRLPGTPWTVSDSSYPFYGKKSSKLTRTSGDNRNLWLDNGLSFITVFRGSLQICKYEREFVGPNGMAADEVLGEEGRETSRNRAISRPPRSVSSGNYNQKLTRGFSRLLLLRRRLLRASDTQPVPGRALLRRCGCQWGGSDALPVITTLIPPLASSSRGQSGRKRVNSR